MADIKGNWVVAEVVNGVRTSVMEFDTFVSLDMQRLSRVAEYPVEGGFMSYNKVRQSYVANVVLAYGGVGRMGGTGSVTPVIARLENLATFVNTTRLVGVTTPYAVLEPVTLESMLFDIKRENGGIVTARLRLREVRQVSAQWVYPTGVADASASNTAGLVATQTTSR